MKKSRGVFTVFLAVLLGLGFISIPKSQDVCFASSEKIVDILSPLFGATEENLNHYGIATEEVNSFTPFNDGTLSRLEGSSFTPALVGEEGKKHINTTINVDKAISSYDASGVDLTHTNLELWLNFDIKPNLITRGLTIKLSDENEENEITWAIPTDEIRNLTTRTEIDPMDVKIFGSIVSGVPIGWVKLTLPFGALGVITGELIKENKFTFTKFSLSQTAEIGSDQPLDIYGVKLVLDSEPSGEYKSEISSYSEISLRPSIKVVEENQKFYKGEMFPQLLKKNEVFNACWIGNINYFDGAHENDFVVVADSGLGASSKSEFAYGSSTFSLNSSNYTISYGVRYNGKVVGLLSDNISVSDYGTGVWIDTNKDDITVGSTKKIFYAVHEAFSNASIKFESTNEEVLVIKEINFDNKYLVVETLKKGTAGIKITVTDDRLIGTSYEETGLVNTDFEIDVVKAEKNVNTTKVMLWIAFGLLMVGLVYLAVKAIIDARKIDIK